MYNGYNFQCKECTSRFPGCHSTCKSYIEAKAEGQKVKDKITAKKNQIYQVSAFRSEGVRKALRNR